MMLSITERVGDIGHYWISQAVCHSTLGSKFALRVRCLHQASFYICNHMTEDVDPPQPSVSAPSILSIFEMRLSPYAINTANYQDDQ